MLRGINSKWKQPILYPYLQGAAKGSQIMKTLKEIIIKVFDCGLHVVATVCDQGSNNISAINKLIDDTKAEYIRRGEVPVGGLFEVNGHQIIPLYDTPHLIKGVRNNLLSKDITFKFDNNLKTAKWNDIYTAWQLDNYSGDLRIMPKLTEFHVSREKVKKMKVAVCTQVFSHTVSAAIHLLAKTGELVSANNNTHLMIILYSRASRGEYPNGKKSHRYGRIFEIF